jgi:cell division septum initiation protein DivIVA
MNERGVSAGSPEVESSHEPDHPGQPGTSSTDVDRSVSLTAERVQAIIESATRVRVHAIIESATRIASEILANARAEADGYLAEAEREADRLTMKHIGLISDLTEALSNRLQVYGRQSEELIRALEDAMRELAAGVPSNAASSTGAATPRTEPTPTPHRDPSAGPRDRAPWRSEG